MGTAYKNIYMPSAADFNALILGISESLYDGKYAPTAKSYDIFRPTKWPSAKVLLRNLGYARGAAGWREYMRVMVELPTMTRGDATRLAHERKEKAKPRTSYKFYDCNLAVTYQWPWNGARERG